MTVSVPARTSWISWSCVASKMVISHRVWIAAPICPRTAKGNLAGRMARPFEEHVADVYGYLSYRLGSRAAAEELTRATFENGARGGIALGAAGAEARISLLAIAHRLAASHRGAGTANGDRQVSAELARALAQLPERERAVLALRYGARLSVSKAALVLGQSEGDVRRSFSRGLRRLRTELEREERGQEQEDNS